MMLLSAHHEATWRNKETPPCFCFCFFFYLYDHLDSWQRGGDVLRVWRSHRDGYTTGIQATVKRHNEVDTWRTGGRKTEDKGREE